MNSTHALKLHIHKFGVKLKLNRSRLQGFGHIFVWLQTICFFGLFKRKNRYPCDRRGEAINLCSPKFLIIFAHTQ
jgi:hypothetical protein